MTRLPMLDARIMERVLFRLGFTAERQRGSHVFYRHPDGRTTTVPHLLSRIMRAVIWHAPLVRAILDDIRMSPAELAAILKAL